MNATFVQGYNVNTLSEDNNKKVVYNLCESKCLVSGRHNLGYTDEINISDENIDETISRGGNFLVQICQLNK